MSWFHLVPITIIIICCFLTKVDSRLHLEQLGETLQNSSSATPSGIHCYLYDAATGDNSKCQTIEIITKSTATCGLIGCLSLIFIILLVKLQDNLFSQSILLYLAFAYLIKSIAYLSASLDPNEHMCKFKAWFMFYSESITFLWISILTFNLFMNAVKLKMTNQHKWKYHVVAWGLSFVISMIPVIADVYGPAQVYCWITDAEENGWRFGIGYGQVIFAVLFLFLIYPYIIWFVWKQQKLAETGKLDPDIQRKILLFKDDVNPLIIYPLIYLLSLVIPLVARVAEAIAKNRDSIYELLILHALFANLFEVVYLLIYCFINRDKIRDIHPSQVKRALSKHFCNKAPLMRDVATNTIDLNQLESHI